MLAIDPPGLGPLAYFLKVASAVDSPLISRLV